ncbi:MFS transporter [Sandaracinus amylolyticus]|uniref:MFS permease n=1 Tax=Sandaracinus amylolyticus TaxID=927083 RepID=A0A0F6YFM9_9BACT|nr:MFS transporter [Sandaracinus amylolyticus]AKF03882.1 MFS permease [Sandaracinus amylolyticus]
MKGPLRHRAFLIYQGVRLVSVVAIQMMSVAIAWQVYERTQDAMALGMVGLAQFAPLFLLSPITGDVADRFDRRAVIAVCHGVIALCATLLAWTAAHPELGTAPIYVVLALFGCARAFAGPAAQALLPALVPPAELAQGIALGSITFQLATIAGPALAGFVIAAGGAPSAFATSAVLEVLAVSALLAMRYAPERQERRGSGLTRLLAGVRYVREHPVILGAISLDLFAVLLGGAVALMPIYARDILHVDERGFGFLRAAPAVGAGLVALVLAFRPLRRRAGLTMFACVGLFGVATIVFGVSRSFPLSLAALAVLGGADMVSVVIRQTVVQITTPPEMRGRVAAVNMVFIGASNELGELESGVTAAWLGTVPAVVLGGVGTLLVTVIWAFLFPQLRDVDRPEEHDAR